MPPGYEGGRDGEHEGVHGDRSDHGVTDASIAWYRAIGALIEAPVGDDLPGRLIAALEALVPFDLAALFVYRGRARPLGLYDNFERAGAKKGITAYVENTYMLNPFYQACLRGLAEGVYRIRDLAPDAFFESEYYRSYRIVPLASEEIGYITEDWPAGLEEIDLAVDLAPGVSAEISLYRSLSGRGFGDRELDRLGAVVPVIGALLRRYWAALGPPAASPDSRLDDAFMSFGEGVLSAREREVVRMILRGHSSESISFNLGISLGTVKTHRKNAYAKLGISSQSGLLSRFLRSLRIAPATPPVVAKE